MFGVFNRPSLPLILGSSTAGPLCSVPISGLSLLLRAPPPPSHERPFPFRLSGHPLLSRGFSGTCDGFSSSRRLPFSRASSITPLASPLTVLGFRADSAFAVQVAARPPGFELTRLLVSSLPLRPAISLIRPRRTLSIGFKRILLRLLPSYTTAGTLWWWIFHPLANSSLILDATPGIFSWIAGFDAKSGLFTSQKSLNVVPATPILFCFVKNPAFPFRFSCPTESSGIIEISASFFGRGKRLIWASRMRALERVNLSS